MANAMYGLGREAYLNGEIDYFDDNIKFGLIAAGYTVSIDVHDFHDDLSSIVDTSANLASKTSTLGVADAADEVFTAVTGSDITQMAFWRDSGVSSTSALFLHLDTATGLPTTPNSSDITVTFDSGANKIFKL